MSIMPAGPATSTPNPAARAFLAKLPPFTIPAAQGSEGDRPAPTYSAIPATVPGPHPADDIADILDLSGDLDELAAQSDDFDIIDSHTAADEAALTGFEIARDGLVTLDPEDDSADLGRDRSSRHRWEFRKGLCRGRIEREMRTAQQVLLDCYGQGQAAGDAGRDRIIPHGMTPEQGRHFLMGWDAGKAIRDEELAATRRPARRSEGAITDRDAYGSRAYDAIAESARDAREWSFAD